MPPASEVSKDRDTPKVDRRGLINRLAKAMTTRLSPGDVAKLRRLEPSTPLTSSFWWIMSGYVEPAGVLPESETYLEKHENMWATVLSGMAIMQGNHASGRRLGQALAQAGYSELRFVRLMRADSDQLQDLVRTTARYLGSKAEKVDWYDFYDLIFSEGTDWAERVRRRIARDYYRNLSSK